jgi:hypothetical protein
MNTDAQLHFPLWPFPLGALTVEVEESDLAEGVRCNTKLCPLALAVNRATGWFWSLSRTNGIALNLHPGQRCWFYLPQAAFEQQRRIDQNESVSPFRFDINIEIAPEYLPPDERRQFYFKRGYLAPDWGTWGTTRIEEWMRQTNVPIKSSFHPFYMHCSEGPEAYLNNLQKTGAI